MTTAEIARAVEEHVSASAEDLADALYEQAKAALDRGDDREQVQATFQQCYERAARQGQRRERRAIGIVLSYFDGYCSPISAL